MYNPQEKNCGNCGVGGGGDGGGSSNSISGGGGYVGKGC